MNLKIIRVVVICSLIILGFIAFLFENPKPIILGYILGTSISILSFNLINNSAIKLITMEPSMAKRRTYFNFLSRFLIYFIVLSIAAIADYLNLLATFIGLTMVKSAIYILIRIDKDF